MYVSSSWWFPLESANISYLIVETILRQIDNLPSFEHKFIVIRIMLYMYIFVQIWTYIYVHMYYFGTTDANGTMINSKKMYKCII